MSKPDTSDQSPRGFQTHHFQTLSIRDELEKLAWMQNPRLARRMTRRMASRRRTQRNRLHNKPTMRWQDRTLISLSAVLLALFVIRAESAVADEPIWGLQLNNDSGTGTQLAISTDVQVDITGLIARAGVTQKFNNHGKYWAEGIYRFPLPQGAAVDRRRNGDRLAQTDIPGLLPAGTSLQLAGYPNTAIGWPAQLLLSLFVLLLSSSLLWFSGSRLPMVKT